MISWLKEHGIPGFLIALAVFLIAVFAADMVAEARADAEYARRCEQIGGHAVNINHDPLCVSDDGRVIEP